MNGQARQIQIHGGDIYRNRNVTDYSVNSNPLGPPDAVLEAEKAYQERVQKGLDLFARNYRELWG